MVAPEPRLDIGQPNVIRPSIGVNRFRVAAFIIGAVDQDAVDTGFPHLSEGDFLLAGEGGHDP
jgi:hypothetical protein